MVKEILHPENAVLAVDSGVAGIFFFNHAGNLNDTAITSWVVLPVISDAVESRLKIIAGTAVRMGSDVLKGLALGADAVAIDRATLYGVAASVEAGATRALNTFKSKIYRTMAVMGLNDTSSIGRGHIRLPADLHISGSEKFKDKV